MKSNWYWWLLGLVVGWLLIDTLSDQKLFHASEPLHSDTADCWTGAGPNQIPEKGYLFLPRIAKDVMEKMGPAS